MKKNDDISISYDNIVEFNLVEDGKYFEVVMFNPKKSKYQTIRLSNNDGNRQFLKEYCNYILEFLEEEEQTYEELKYFVNSEDYNLGKYDAILLSISTLLALLSLALSRKDGQQGWLIMTVIVSLITLYKSEMIHKQDMAFYDYINSYESASAALDSAYKVYALLEANDIENNEDENGLEKGKYVKVKKRDYR